MISTKLRSGPVTIPKKCQSADTGLFQLHASLSKTTVMMTRTLAHHPATCRTKAVFLSKTRMYQNIVTSRSSSSTALMLTGRLDLFSPPTHSWTTELQVSLMDSLTALTVLVTSVQAAQSRWSTQRLMIQTFVAILAQSTVNGLKVFTPVSTVIWALFKPCVSGKVFQPRLTQWTWVFLASALPMV